MQHSERIPETLFGNRQFWTQRFEALAHDPLLNLLRQCGPVLLVCAVTRFSSHGATVLLDSQSHLVLAGRAVLFLEGAPYKDDWQDGEMTEEAAPHEIVVWTVQLEEKRLAGIKGTEMRARARLPEIDFIRLEAGQVAIPIAVGDGNVQAHVEHDGASMKQKQGRPINPSISLVTSVHGWDSPFRNYASHTAPWVRNIIVPSWNQMYVGVHDRLPCVMSAVHPNIESRYGRVLHTNFV